MKRITALLLPLLILINSAYSASAKPHYLTLLKEMFANVTLHKNAKAIPIYYSKDFELHTNGITMTYNDMLKSHEAIFKTPIQYKIRYDNTAAVEHDNKVAARLFITTSMPNEAAHEIEVLIIAEYKDGLIYRVWELTYPDWSKLKELQKINKQRSYN